MGRQTMEKIRIEVVYTVEVSEKTLKQLVAEAEERGHGYGDPGKKELVRRLLIDDGAGWLEEEYGRENFAIAVHEPAQK
jgi:hypothetical protein